MSDTGATASCGPGDAGSRRGGQHRAEGRVGARRSSQAPAHCIGGKVLAGTAVVGGPAVGVAR
jgi:hypothetical protein